MVGHAKVATLHKVYQVTHGRHESVGKRRHVSDICAFGCICHLNRFGMVHRQRFLAQNVLPFRDSLERNLRMYAVWGGDDNRMDIVAFQNVFVVTRHDGSAGLNASTLQSRSIGIANSGNPDSATKRQTGQMVLQRDSAAANDGEVDWVYGHSAKSMAHDVGHDERDSDFRRNRDAVGFRERSSP